MGYGSLNGVSMAPSMQDLAADARSLGALKAGSDKATPETIRETAKQFESLFMRELIKSMREATAKSGLLDGAAARLARGQQPVGDGLRQDGLHIVGCHVVAAGQQGLCLGVSASGALRLADEQGTRDIHSSEVSVRPLKQDKDGC